MTAKSIDSDAFHRVLWERSDRLNSVRFSQRDLAAEFGVTKFAVHRTLTAFLRDGRMTKSTRAKTLRNARFVIVDPDKWKDLQGEVAQ